MSSSRSGLEKIDIRVGRVYLMGLRGPHLPATRRRRRGWQPRPTFLGFGSLIFITLRFVPPFNLALLRSLRPRYYPVMKVVGNRQPPKSPEEALRRADRLIREASRLAPHPPARGFVFKAKTWEDYEQWKASQSNPRLW